MAIWFISSFSLNICLVGSTRVIGNDSYCQGMDLDRYQDDIAGARAKDLER
jgi:hypothetical protein